MTQKLAPLLSLSALFLLTTPLRAEAEPISPGVAPPAPRPIGAERPEMPPVAWTTPPQRSPWHWYGWQVALADVPAYVVFALANPFATEYGSKPSDELIEISVLVYLVGGPVVHGAHRRWGYSAASLGLRATVLFTGFVAGFGGGCHEMHGPMEVDYKGYYVCAGFYSALLASAGMGTVLDAVAFGWEPVPAAAAKPVPAPYHAEIAPVVSPGFVGVTGRF
jgi:hypothetical protein